LLLSAAALLLFLLFTLLLIPDRLLLDSANNLLAREGLSLTAASFSKKLPLGIKGKGWELSSQNGQLLKLDNATLSIQLLPLVAGQVRISLDAALGGGKIAGRFSLLKAPFCKLSIKGIQLEHIPFFSTVANTRAAGILNAEIDLTGSGQKAEGYLKLDAQGVDLKGIKLGEMPLPDATYKTVQGMMRVSKGMSRLESLTLQGDGLYARLKGNIPQANPLSASQLDLTLELMPKPELLEKQKFIFLLLTKYLDTPGHYQIPIRGTLGKPLME
jgi:type II secretion system protein N